MPSIYDFGLVRGDSFELDVGLSIAFAEALIDPAQYEARMCFRMEQSDLLPNIFEMVSTLTPSEYPTELARVYATFTATPEQTGALPPYDLVHYVELRTIDGTSVVRLFQGKVKLTD